MSEMEYHKGTLTPVKLTGSRENIARELCRQFNLKMNSDYFDSWSELLEEDGCDSVIEYNNMFYYLNDTQYDLFNICNAQLNDDGVISYDVSFYNGGASLSEAIEGSIKTNFSVDELAKIKRQSEYILMSDIDRQKYHMTRYGYAEIIEGEENVHPKTGDTFLFMKLIAPFTSTNIKTETFFETADNLSAFSKQYPS